MWKTHSSDFMVAPEEYCKLGPAKMLGRPEELLIYRLRDGATGNRRIIWKLPRGVWPEIEEERHCHDHLLVVLQGQGTISILGMESHYGAYDEFMVFKGEPHRIVRVDTDTVVLQIQPPVPQQPRV